MFSTVTTVVTVITSITIITTSITIKTIIITCPGHLAGGGRRLKSLKTLLIQGMSGNKHHFDMMKQHIRLNVDDSDKHHEHNNYMFD